MLHNSNHMNARLLAQWHKPDNTVYYLKFLSNKMLLSSYDYNTYILYEDVEQRWTFHGKVAGSVLRLNKEQTFQVLFYKDNWMDRIELQDTDGRCLQTTSCSHMKQELCYGYSPNQKWLLTYDDNCLSFWNAQTLNLVKRCRLVSDAKILGFVDRLHFSLDEKYLFFRCGTRIGQCQVDLNIPTVVPKGYISQDSSSIEDFTISPQGRIVAVTNEGRPAVKLYKYPELEYIASLDIGSYISPYLLAFSPNGNYLACVDYECRVYIWNMQTMHLELSFVSHAGPHMEPESSVASLAWSPCGDVIAIGGSLYEINDFSVKIWKIENVK